MENINNKGHFSFNVGFKTSITYIYNNYVEFITCNGTNGDLYAIGKNPAGYWTAISMKSLSYNNGIWTMDGWTDLDWVGATINWVAYK